MAWVVGSDCGSYTAIVIVSTVTPWYVAPPLSPLNGGTHGGAYSDGTLMRPNVVSQFGSVASSVDADFRKLGDGELPPNELLVAEPALPCVALPDPSVPAAV